MQRQNSKHNDFDGTVICSKIHDCEEDVAWNRDKLRIKFHWTYRNWLYSPLRSTRWLHNGSQAKFEKIPVLAHIHDIENDTLRINIKFRLNSFNHKMIMLFTWSCFTLSTVKLNQNRNRGLHVSGRKNKSYSNSPTRSARPKLPVSNAASKHKWPRFALPLCPGGRIITRLTLPKPPSPSLSSESVVNHKKNVQKLLEIIINETFVSLIHATKFERITSWHEHHFDKSDNIFNFLNTKFAIWFELHSMRILNQD